MIFPPRWTSLLVCWIALVCTACGSSDQGAMSTGSSGPAGVPGSGPAATDGGGQLNLSAHAVTLHRLTAELVNLMDDVNRRKIMNPPIRVSDVRNAFFEHLDWIDAMTPEDVAELRQAGADLDALIAEIRAHENAAGDAALEERLKKIEGWNQSIMERLPG